MQRKYGVAIYNQSHYSNGGYKHLEFRFVFMGEGWQNGKEFLSLTWQSHLEDGEGKPWYACHAKIDTSDFEVIRMASNMVRRLFGDSSFWGQSPEHVLELIEQKRDIRIVTYDSRLNKFLYNEDIAPVEWFCWRDSENSVHAVAADEETARDAVEKRFRGVAEQRYFGMGRVDEWVAAGRPVAVVDRRSGPTVRTAEQAIAL